MDFHVFYKPLSLTFKLLNQAQANFIYAKVFQGIKHPNFIYFSCALLFAQVLPSGDYKYRFYTPYTRTVQGYPSHLFRSRKISRSEFIKCTDYDYQAWDYELGIGYYFSRFGSQG